MTLSVESRLDYLLDFPFRFTINNVWCQLFIIRAVGFGLMILGKKIDMEDGVDLHGWRKGEVVGDRGEFLGNGKGAISTGC